MHRYYFSLLNIISDSKKDNMPQEILQNQQTNFIEQPTVRQSHLEKKYQTKLQDQKYNINLMWINANQQEEQEYIYPSCQDNAFGKEYLNKILSWARKNPAVILYIWFDSYVIKDTDKVISQTQHIIAQESQSISHNMAKIELRDIRDLPIVRNNPEIFSEKIPIYFRVDLLRNIITKELLEHEPTTRCVYADFDVQPMNETTLFDQNTVSILEKKHFVMAYEHNKFKFENTFQVFAYNETVIEALQSRIIQDNLERAQRYLEDLEDPFFHTQSIKNLHAHGFQENVFYSYPIMNAYLHHNQCDIQFSSESIDGIDLLENAKIVGTRKPIIDFLSRYPIPTKKVSVPESKSSYTIHKQH
jgi:hypothetical protein